MNELILEKEKNKLNVKELDNDINLEKEQNNFLKTNLGQVINSGIDIGLKAILPNFIEDEIISIKDSLITEGFSAAVDTAIEEAMNIGKSALGILTGTFENVSQIDKAVEKGGLIDTISGLIDTGINWAKEKGFIKSNTAKIIKNGKNTILNTIEDGVKNNLTDQITAIEKIDGYIEKWKKYYNEQNFNNMEYQYEKIQEYMKEVIPLEETLKKAREVENLHELIKNKGKSFDLTEEEKELANILN